MISNEETIKRVIQHVKYRDEAKLESEVATDFEEASKPEFQEKIDDFEEEVSRLSESITEIEKQKVNKSYISFPTDFENVNPSDTLASKQLQLNLPGNKIEPTNSNYYDVCIYDVSSGDVFEISTVTCYDTGEYPMIGVAFSFDESMSLITSEDGEYDYFLGNRKTTNTDTVGRVVVPIGAVKMYVTKGKDSELFYVKKSMSSYIKFDNNPLIGKKLGVLGDSIAYGYGASGGFGKMIADNNAMTVQNVAVTGATISKGIRIADGTEIPSIYDQVALLDNDCDIIVFDGCFNDRGAIEDGRIPLGTMTPIEWYRTNSFNTFCHCFENLLEALVHKFHGKPILYVYHHPIERAKDTVHDSVLQILNKWSIPYVD